MLKNDYKDDIYEGSRKWRVAQNEDGTSTITDATTYTQKGDKFGQNDVNAITGEINKIERVTKTTLLAGAWSAASPYTQAISLPDVTATDVPIIGISIADGTTAANVKAQNKAWGCVDRAVTGNGTIAFYCYNKKPAVNFSVNIKGV